MEKIVGFVVPVEFVVFLGRVIGGGNRLVVRRVVVVVLRVVAGVRRVVLRVVAR